MGKLRLAGMPNIVGKRVTDIIPNVRSLKIPSGSNSSAGLLLPRGRVSGDLGLSARRHWYSVAVA